MGWMAARRPGSCNACGAPFQSGARILWTGQVAGCPACGGNQAPAQAQAPGTTPADMDQPAQEAPVAPRAARPVVEAPSFHAAQRALEAHMARLDPDQRAVAALRPEHGNAQVLAGAGAGKTTATVAAVAGAVAEGVDPESIAVVTFTRKGGDELRERLARLVPPGTMSRFRHVGTYDSMACRWLSRRDPTLWDMARCIAVPGRASGVPAAATLWEAILTGRAEGVHGTGERGLEIDNPEVGAYILAVDVARSVPASAAEIDARVQAAEGALGLRRLYEAWSMFQRAKRALGAWDFLDARHAFYAALVAGEVAGARWVLVDEAQDNTALDLACATGLAQRAGGAVVLIGDVRQSIFEWRGADPEILATADRVLNARCLPMARNYRSGGRIVRAGNLIAAGQPWAVGPQSTVTRDLDGTLGITGHAEPMAAAMDVADAIRAEGGDLTRHAILCRTNAAAGVYEAALLQAGVPCVVVGGSAFFSRREVKDALAYLTLSEKDDVEALARAVRVPKTFLGRAFLDSVRLQAGDMPTRIEAAGRAVARRSGTINARDLASFIRGLRAEPSLARRAERVANRLATGAADVGAGNEDPKGTLARALAVVAARFEGVEALLAFAARCAADTLTVSDDQDAPAGRVTISTIHKAKGREWSHVVVDATEGAFPHSRSSESPRRMAEERRLFYVACTRAKEHLDLTWCEMGLYPNTGGPSPFLRLVAAEAGPTPPDLDDGPRGPDGDGGGLPEGNSGENPDPSAEAERAIEAMVAMPATVAARPRSTIVDDILADEYRVMAQEVAEAGVDAAERAHGLPSAADLAALGLVPAEADAPAPAGASGWATEAWSAAQARAEAATAAEPAARPGSGGRYVQVTLDDFVGLLGPLGFTNREEGGQVVFAVTRQTSAGTATIKVYTSIPHAGAEATAREVGEDSIKVAGVWRGPRDPKAFPLHKRLPYAARTRGWRLAVLARVAEVAALFTAATCRKCGAPTVERARRDGVGTFRGCCRYPHCK